LLDEVKGSGCPPVRRQRFDVGPFALVGEPPPANGVADGCAPRRTVLDKILVDAASPPGRSCASAQGSDQRPGDHQRLPRRRHACARSGRRFPGTRPSEEALAEYERRRNEQVMPIYEFTQQFGALEPPPPEMQALFAALREDEEQTGPFLGTVAGTGADRRVLRAGERRPDRRRTGR
jgi:hypothetical protein